MLKKITATLAVAAASVVLVAAPAQARPGGESTEAPYCGPGLTDRVFDVRTGGTRTSCRTEYNRELIECSWWNIVCRLAF